MEKTRGGGARAREGPSRAERPAVGGGGEVGLDAHVACPGWSKAAADAVRPETDVSSTAELISLGLEGGDPRFGMGEVYIGIEGARKLRMRSALRPRDRDRTL